MYISFYQILKGKCVNYLRDTSLSSNIYNNIIYIDIFFVLLLRIKKWNEENVSCIIVELFVLCVCDCLSPIKLLNFAKWSQQHNMYKIWIIDIKSNLIKIFSLSGYLQTHLCNMKQTAFFVSLKRFWNQWSVKLSWTFHLQLVSPPLFCIHWRPE